MVIGNIKAKQGCVMGVGMCLYVQLVLTNKQCNKNLAIANRSRVSCADNALRASIGLNITPWPWNLGTQGHWKRNHWIDHTDLLSVELFDVEYYRDIEMWIRGHSRSLKVVPFESLGTVSCSPSIVTMAVPLDISEIFSIKEWPDLEIWV